MLERAAQWRPWDCPGSVNSALLHRNPLIAKPHTPIHHIITWTKFFSYQNWKVTLHMFSRLKSWPLHSIRRAYYLKFSSWCFCFLICIMKIKPRGFKSMAIYFCLSYFCVEVLLPATPQPWLSIVWYWVFSGTKISFQWELAQTNMMLFFTIV